jgi:hypothetical protein
MDLREVQCDGVEWIYLFRDTVKWQAHSCMTLPCTVVIGRVVVVVVVVAAVMLVLDYNRHASRVFVCLTYGHNALQNYRVFHKIEIL